MINLIDVSDQQSNTPNLSGQSGILIKASEGHTFLNKRQAAQAHTARAAGLVVGFYHFLWPGNIAEQAAYFVNRCASVAGDSLWIDWETTEAGTAATCAEKDAMLAEVKRLRPDHQVGLYCNRDFWLSHDTTSDAGDGLWIADPSAPKGHPRIKAPWLIHQYGKKDGTDQNVAQFPTLSAMAKWQTAKTAKTPPRKTPPTPTPPPATYKIKAGDTLTSIAEAHDTTWQHLAKINGIKNPDHIEAGSTIKLR